ncbi:MAG: molybdopterin-dependent oxidoreductase [Acidimicrobiia bacterium]|nr:molybdopterin-dependent oxidoreductase [Acidimicrobiia bacterium]
MDMTPRSLAAIAGATSAAVALGTAEAVAALVADGRSLVVSVGDGVVDGSGAWLARPAIELLGSANKPTLLTGIVVVSLAVGALAGIGARRRAWVGPVIFAAFAALGVLAAGEDPLADRSQAAVAAGLGAVAGAAVLWFLLRLLSASATSSMAATAVAADASTGAGPIAGTGPAPAVLDPAAGGANRRAFFGWVGVAGATAGALAVAPRTWGRQSTAEQARETVVLPGVDEPPAVAEPEVADLSSYITPNDDFFRIDTALVIPDVDPAGWSLTIDGMVDRPFEIGYDELVERSTTVAPVTLACVSNLVGGHLVGNAVWQGVPLGELLAEAGVDPAATQIVGRSVDAFTVGFPTEVAFDGRTALVATAMNGVPLPRRHGFPARLVVSGLFGYVSATKWLSQIELTTWEGYDAYWVPRGWSKEGPILVQSRIDTPTTRSVRAGTVPLAGVAWGPGVGISRVEVRIDEGPWMEAELGETLSDDTWVQWYLPWEATPGQHDVEVRATDGLGDTQTSERSPTAPSGATGWHLRTIDVFAD